MLTQCAVESARRQNPGHRITVYSDGFRPDAFAASHLGAAVRPLRLYSRGAAAAVSEVEGLDALRRWLSTGEVHRGFVFNNVRAFSVHSLRCESPRVLQKAVVSVALRSDGGVQSSEPLWFHYILLPVVSTVTPMIGPVFGGTMLDLLGIGAFLTPSV